MADKFCKARGHEWSSLRALFWRPELVRMFLRTLSSCRAEHVGLSLS